MKYVIFETTVNGQKRELPVIFPDLLVHRDVGRYLTHCIGLVGAKVVAAGFCGVEVSYCGGGSDSLRLDSRPAHDAKVINAYDFTQGLLFEDAKPGGAEPGK